MIISNFLVALNEQDKEMNITIEVPKVENPNQIPLGQSVDIICRTKWMSSKIFWNFNDKDISKYDG